MEALSIMHCGSLSFPSLPGGGRGVLSERQQQQQKLVVISTTATRKTRSGGPVGLRVLRERSSKSSSAAVGPSFASICSLRGDEFASPLRPSSTSEWCTLHFHSPSCSSAISISSTSSSSFSVSRQVSSTLGPLSITSADRVVGHDKALLIEEEQKSLLKRKADNIRDDLRGASIFLVGMMGSGKTTVGRHVAEALGYCFFDSDKLVEDAAGGVTVAQMFREGREEDFRNAESETIMQLSSHGRLVVATGGGAVVRPQNWGYMRHGVTVWLDVPVEDLARRVVAVGCDSRPLLGQTSPESAYNQALRCLENLYEEREGYYKNADAVVSVAASATIMGLDDVNAVTPTMIAVAVVEEITSLIAQRKSSRRLGRVGNY